MLFRSPKVEAPPPPFVPPPEVVVAPSTAPTIESVAAPPVVAPVIAPPPPVVVEAPPAPAPAPAPPAPPRPVRTDIGVACPTQVTPEMPRKAIQDGTVGVVRAKALIKDGAVREVTILSGPRVFHAAVRSAMLQYKCSSDAGPEGIEATQEFSFKTE